MVNPYYTEDFQGQENQLAVALHVESELRRIQTGFDLLPHPGLLSGAAGRFVTTEGAANEYTITVAGIEAYEEGLNFLVRFHETNTTASTIDMNALGAVEIRTLFGNPVQAGDLQNIRRLTYVADGHFVMQTIALSDLRDSAEIAVAELSQGPPGIPGASTVFNYNRLLTGETPNAAGEYRFLMTPAGTVGVNSDAGLRLAGALEIYDVDATTQGREVFYDEVRVGDIFVFFISVRRWYAYTVESIETPRSDNTRLWAISLFTYEDGGGTGNLPTVEAPISFRWSRARAAIGGVRGVTADQIIPELLVTIHRVPTDYTTDPLTWPIHPSGFVFRNNMGDTKVLVATILENGNVLTAVQHAGYLYQWVRDGDLFTPMIPDPILLPTQMQITTRRFLLIDARDVVDGGQHQFSCRVCLA